MAPNAEKNSKASKKMPKREINQRSIFQKIKRGFFIIAVAVLSYLLYGVFVPNKSPIVQTTGGQLQGTVGKSRIGRPFYSYVGVPFAHPPVGPELRFEPPVPAKPWEGLKQANKYGSQCLQIDVITSIKLGSEDCLYLNVFVPKHAKDSGKLLPVLFWVYGGGFQSGAAHIYRPTYFMDEDVVFVSINYRLGAMGFLNSGDDLIRGNQGMHDLLLGLKWVQENIRNFSGDPKSVTIFGESAGGGAVHFLMLSPLSKGLFHRALSQSGNVLNDFIYSRYPKEQSQSLAKRVGCPAEPSEDMVKCLKTVDGRDIVETHREMRLPPRPLLGKYAPSMEAVADSKTLFSDRPIDMLKRGDFLHIPWMTGIDSQEGLPFAQEILEQQFLIDWANRDWDDFITQVVFLKVAPNRDPNTAQKLKEFYFNNSTMSRTQSFHGLSELHGARFFFFPAHLTAKYHAAKAPVYLYYYDYPTEFGFLKLMHSLRGRYVPVIETAMEIVWHWVQKILGLEIHRRGTSHGEEMLLQFDFPFVPGAPLGSSDYEMSKELIKSWVTFATNPSKLSFKSHKWPAQDPKDSKLKYMEISPRSRGMIAEPFSDQVKFWDSLNVIV